MNRKHFALWLTGFTDGEGYFGLTLPTNFGDRLPVVEFSIGLRADDADVLDRIREFWGCGRLSRRPERKPHPTVTYSVSDVESLATVVVPHFRRYPLMDGIRQRTVPRPPGSRGPARKWTPEDIRLLTEYHDAIKQGRSFTA